MTPRIHRFDFSTLRDFRVPVSLVSGMIPVADEAPPYMPPAPIFNEEDMESARLSGRKQGYQEGFLAGKQDEKKLADQKIEDGNQVIAALGERVDDLTARYRAMLEIESGYLSSLVLAVARKIAGEAIASNGQATIAAIIQRCLPVIFSKPRLIIEMNAEIIDHARERIETQLRRGGFEGEIQFKSAAGLSEGDVNLDWGGGQIHRRTDDLWKEIETLIERIPLELTFAETLKNNPDRTGD